MTRNAGFEERLTLLSYAAWRRRYQAIKQLLVAAASPTISQRAPLGALGAASNDEAELCALLSRRHGHGVDSATACHIVECVGRMRTVAARDASLGATHPPCGMCGADGLSVLFDPCGCVVCEACVWRAVLRPPAEHEQRGEVTCPSCHAVCPGRGAGSSTGHTKLDECNRAAAMPPPHEGMATVTTATGAPSDGVWMCECCMYANFGARDECRNCAARRPPAGRAPPPSLCPMRAVGVVQAASARCHGGPAAATEPPAPTTVGGGCGDPDEVSRESILAPSGGDAHAPARYVCLELEVIKRRAVGPLLIFLNGRDIRLCTSDQAPGGGTCARLPTRHAAHGDTAVNVTITDAPAAVEEMATGEGSGEAALCSGRDHENPAAKRYRVLGRHWPHITGNALTDWCAAPPEHLQLVLDRHVLDRSVLDGEADHEADLAMSRAAVGDRVRAYGRVHAAPSAPDGARRWELRVTRVLLLRPAIRAIPGPPQPHCAEGAPTAAVATEAVPSSARTSKPKLRALPPREAAIAQLCALTDQQKCDKASGAAVSGDCLVLDALATLGFDMSAVIDDYGQTALLIAASHGHARAVRMLLRHGAMSDVAAHGGVTAASAAAAHGHAEVLAALADAGADLGTCGSEGLAPIEYVMRRARGTGEGVPQSCSRVPRRVGAPPARLVRLIAPDADHPGAGACYIDGGVPEAGLAALVALFGRLPLHPRTKCTQALSDRAYYCDAEGWVGALLRAACLAGRQEAARAAAVDGTGSESGTAAAALLGKSDATGKAPIMPCEGEAMEHMRFLIYAEAGGGLPPHVDLSRTRARDGRTSRCTFILYLSDCDAGGKTVLLDRLTPLPFAVLAAVPPRRGRLLLFPHACPHRADEVVAEGLPKILLRGEMI